MGPWDRFVIMLVPIVFILAVAGIVILRPLSKRLGQVLELMVEDRHQNSLSDFSEILRRLDSIERRLSSIEDDGTNVMVPKADESRQIEGGVRSLPKSD